MAGVGGDDSGQLTYPIRERDGFSATVTLTNMRRDHVYRFSLNGKVGGDGNDRLPQPVGNRENYLDFSGSLTTDADGSGSAQLFVVLDSGKYDVKFLVKDPDNRWRVVLVNDNLRFTVE